MKLSTRTASAIKDRHLLKIVQVLDRRILAAVDGAASADQRTKFLARVHQHLMAPVIELGQAPAKRKRPSAGKIKPGVICSLEHTDIVHALLCGEVTVGPDLKFQAGDSFPADELGKMATVNADRPMDPAVVTFAYDLIERFHRQLTRAAQQTRPHHQEELADLLRIADANLMTYALERFGLLKRLDLPFLRPDSLDVTALPYLMAAEGSLGVSWSTDGPRFEVLGRPPSLALKGLSA